MQKDKCTYNHDECGQEDTTTSANVPTTAATENFPAGALYFTNNEEPLLQNHCASMLSEAFPTGNGFPS